MLGHRRAITATACVAGWLTVCTPLAREAVEIDAVVVSDRLAVVVSAHRDPAGIDIEPRALGAATVARVGVRFRFFLSGLFHGL